MRGMVPDRVTTGKQNALPLVAALASRPKIKAERSRCDHARLLVLIHRLRGRTAQNLVFNIIIRVRYATLLTPFGVPREVLAPQQVPSPLGRCEWCNCIPNTSPLAAVGAIAHLLQMRYVGKRLTYRRFE